MTRRTIWILNFSTTLVVFIVFILGSLRGGSSDKDSIVIFFLVAIIIYLAGIVYLFYNGIYKWEAKQAQSFYGASFPIAALSFFGIINITRNIGNEQTTLSETLVLIVCGLNAITFCWGLATNRN